MSVFFFNDTATTEIYTLSLHDALPISRRPASFPLRKSSNPRTWLVRASARCLRARAATRSQQSFRKTRSEEHTSELQSRQYLVCRLLLEKKLAHPPYFLCVDPALHHPR